MPGPSFTTGQVLTAAEMNQLAQMDVFSTAVSASVNPCVAGTLYIITNGSSNLTFTLPSPTAGIAIGFKKADSGAGGNTITAGSGVILGPGTGAAGSSSIACSALGAYVILQGDGTNWHIVAGAQDSGWVNATLGNSWAAASTSVTPGYRLRGNRVYLRGIVNGGTNGTSPFTLPSGFRPATIGSAILSMTGNDGGTSPSAAQVQVTSAGVVSLYAASTATGIAMDGLSFAVD